MALLNPEQRLSLIAELAERGFELVVVRIHGEHMFFLRQGGKLINDGAWVREELDTFMELNRDE